MKRRSAGSVAFPRTSTEAKAVVEAAANRTQWQDSEDGQTRLVHTHDDAATRRRAALVVVRTSQGEARAQATLKRKAREG